MHINYWKEIRSNNLGKAGLLLLALVIMTALFAPLFSSFNPLEQSADSFRPPSGKHWLGTNDVGQDIFAQMAYGARTSLAVAVTVALLSTAAGAFMGVTSALLGGIYEKTVMRAVDALLVIPPMLPVIIIAAYIQPGIWSLAALLSLLIWPVSARIIRAQTLVLKEKAHVRAARTFGGGTLYLMFRHIIPDLGPILTAGIVQGARRAVFMEAGLSFLGVTDPMTVSWGKMLYQSLRFVYLDAWQWWLLPVAYSLAVTVMAFTFIGYALEEAINPRLRRSRHA